ncbi:Putative Uroporphyrinogen III synthase HemD (modular protein) [Nitrospira japonica]|uniref:Putative Uroporphyrinogen III synthase HemD (Modular protein) n=1 Tax=Nitrospira japonica TaxID=1325564 RepID=A0A1W1I1X5_9BACT|nr:uroporphyrinogen-III synthase [Nitrospira japonica]SLM46981.1 Putative Uroporphyrinogen III synthase HemD (modular protein) [Nitrospira japonica]
MTRSDQAERLRTKSRQLAVGVLKLLGALPRTPDILALEPSIVKAVTSLAAGCRALVRSASQTEEAVGRLDATNEADDCLFWLDLLVATAPEHEAAIRPWLEELADLTALLSTDVKLEETFSVEPSPDRQSASDPVEHGTQEGEATGRPLRMLSFESRMAKDMARLIEHAGGTPLVAPALREISIPLQENGAVFRFGVKLMLHQIDIVILLTGVGTRALLETLQIRYPLAQLIEALKHTMIVTRGPKPLAALKHVGLEANLTVPEPNTWQDVVATLDYYRPVQGLRVAVQEYGVSNPDLINDLKTRGAEVFVVPLYRWAMPIDTTPMTGAIEDVLRGAIDVLLVTNAAQIDHVMQLVERDGKTEAFRIACRRLVIASIGPTASERLRHYDLPVDMEPSHPKMGILVKEAAALAPTLLQRKRCA